MRAHLLALAFLLAGCDAVFGPDGVALDTDRDEYVSGATAALTLHNDSDETASMAPLECARLDRRVDSEWAPDPDGNDRICARILISVVSGNVLTAEVTLEGVGAGTYRFFQETSLEDAVSASFEIR